MAGAPWVWPPVTILPDAVQSVFGRTGAVVAALGDYAASLINNDSSVAGATVKAALNTLLARTPFEGFADTVINQQLFGAFPIGGTFDLPGPAGGFTHRVYDIVIAVSNTLAAPLTVGIGVSFNAAIPLQQVGSGVATSISLPSSSGFAPILATGEFIRLTNLGANAGRIYALYRDVNKPTWTSVRASPTAAPTTIIPAPAAGTVNKLVLSATLGSNPGFGSLSTRNYIMNRDTVTHSFEYTIGGLLVGRSAAHATLTASLTFPSGLIATPGNAVAANTTEAVVTTAPMIFLTYENAPA